MFTQTDDVEVRVTLKHDSAPETGAFNMAWTVTAKAKVRVTSDSDDEPGELLVEDLSIDEFHYAIVTMGCVRQIEDPQNATTARIYDQQTVDFLNAQLQDRDDWQDLIKAAAIKKAGSLVHA